MKKLFILMALVFSTSAIFAQGGWLRPNVSYGTISYRAAFDSVLFYPTGCGVPTRVFGYDLHHGAIYYDSCGHKAYLYDPSSLTWSAVNTGTPAANYWTLASTTLYNNSGDNVGIGTTVPAAKLHVVGATLTLSGPSVHGGRITSLNTEDSYFLNHYDSAFTKLLNLSSDSLQAGDNVVFRFPRMTGVPVMQINGQNPNGFGQLTIATGSVAGMNKQIQFNNGGSMGADTSFFWDKIKKLLSIKNNDTILNAGIELSNLENEEYKYHYSPTLSLKSAGFSNGFNTNYISNFYLKAQSDSDNVSAFSQKLGIFNDTYITNPGDFLGNHQVIGFGNMGEILTKLNDPGTAGYVLTSGGVGYPWVWSAVPVNDLPTVLSNGDVATNQSATLYSDDDDKEVYFDTKRTGSNEGARIGIKNSKGYIQVTNNFGGAGAIYADGLTDYRTLALPDASGTIPVMGDYVNPGNFNVDGTLGAAGDILPLSNINFGVLDNSLRQIYYVDGLTHHQSISFGGFSSTSQGEGFSQAFVGEDPGGIFKGYNGMGANGAPVMTTEGVDGSFSRMEQFDTSIVIVSTDAVTTGITTISTNGVAIIGNISASGTGGQGNISATGNAQVSGTVSTGGYTVATLPAGTIGMLAYVTDALAPSYLVAVVGGGAIKTPVFYNGSAWVAH